MDNLQILSQGYNYPTLTGLNKPRSRNTRVSMLHDLMQKELMVIYWAEKELLRIPIFIAPANQPDMTNLPAEESRNTRESVIPKLEKIFEILKKTPEEAKCPVMEALIKQLTTVVHLEPISTIGYIRIIALEKKIHSYKKASYGVLFALSQSLRILRVMNLFEEIYTTQITSGKPLLKYQREIISSNPTLNTFH